MLDDVKSIDRWSSTFGQRRGHGTIIIDAFWGSTMPENIHIAFLREPCCYKRADKQIINEIEKEFIMTSDFGEVIKKDAPGASICISHMRALHQGLNSCGDDANPNKTELIVILEEGVEPDNDSVEIGMATLIANYFGNRHMRGSMLVGLTWSNHLPHHQRRKHGGHCEMIKESFVHPYHQINTAPWDKNKTNFDFIGQGARAQAYSYVLAEELLETKVANYWDLHVMKTLSTIVKREYQRTGRWNQAAYTFVEPNVFNHPIKFAERLRGSGRLHASSQGDVEEYAFYITLNLSHQWGLTNRLQTMMFWMTFAAMRQAGLYILWEPTEACDCYFEQIFDQPNLRMLPFSLIAFR